VKFATLINDELKRLGKSPIEGVCYEQFCLVENNENIMIFEGKRHIATVHSIREARELIDTINSGC